MATKLSIAALRVRIELKQTDKANSRGLMRQRISAEITDLQMELRDAIRADNAKPKALPSATDPIVVKILAAAAVEEELGLEFSRQNIEAALQVLGDRKSDGPADLLQMRALRATLIERYGAYA